MTETSAGNEVKREAQPVYQAVIALTIPPKGKKMVGTCMKWDINGHVTVFDSNSLTADTVWRTNDGHLYAVPSMLMQANSMEELKADIHKSIDQVFENWKVAFPEPKTMVEVNVESTLLPPQSAVEK
jgi:hypothetical protein